MVFHGVMKGAGGREKGAGPKSKWGEGIIKREARRTNRPKSKRDAGEDYGRANMAISFSFMILHIRHR